MQANWVLVDTGRREDIERIARSVEKIGRRATILSLKECYDEDYKTSRPSEKEIVLYAPVKPCEYATNNYGWLSWLDLKQIRCQKYYTAFGMFLINDDYTMLPLSELRRLWDVLLNRYASEFTGQLFVRPDDNDKCFKAQLMDRREAADLLRALDPETLCVVSSGKSIQREWRCFMHGTKLLTVSQYKESGVILKEPGAPQQVTWLAERLGYQRYPELPPVWVLDIGELPDGRLGVIEVSGSSCAGFYEADHDLIVKTISEEADKHFHLDTLFNKEDSTADVT